MKKRKILVLFPLLGLLMSGCDLPEGLQTATDWMGSNLIDPVAELFGVKKTDNNKEEEKKEEQKEEEHHEEQKQIKRISVESAPESVAQGATISPASVTVRVIYSDGTEEMKAAEEVEIDTSTPGEVEMIVKYGGKETATTVIVVDASQVVHVTGIKYDTGGIYTLDVGGTLKINVTVEPEDATDQSVTFTSKNEAIATVTNDGLVTGVAPGSVAIEIVSNDNPEAKKTVNLTVRAEAAGLPASTKAGYAKLLKGESLKNGEKINVAGAIGETYYVMPQSDGSTNFIKAKAISLQDGALAIDAADEYTVMTLDEGKFALVQADGKFLAATGANSSNYLKAVSTLDDRGKWEIVVDEDGYAVLHAPAVARGYICLNPNSGDPRFSGYVEAKFEKYSVYHNNQAVEEVKVTGISFAQQTYEVPKGSTVEINATLEPGNANDQGISYELQDVQPEGCLTIAGNKVTGVESGSATIVATSHDGGFTASATVTVGASLNYGSAEAPLTVAEACALVDAENPTAQEMFVKGVVKSNKAWSSYGNVDIFLGDGELEFELFRAKTFPEGFDKEGITQDSLVGATILASGTGKLYGTTHELDAGCKVLSIEFGEAKVIASVDSFTGPVEFALNATVTADMYKANVTYTDGSTGTAKVTNVDLDTSTSGEKVALLTVEGWATQIELNVTVLAEALNYGSAEAPLTVAEAYALVEAENPTAQNMYVKGVVKSNKAWSSYGNVDIVLSDGEHDFTLYRANTFPEGFDKEGIKVDSLVGATLTATGKGKIYNTTHELDAGCQVLAVEGLPEAPTITGIVSVEVPTSVEVGESLALANVKVTVQYSDDTTAIVSATKVELDTSTAGDNVEGIAYVGGLSIGFTINVVEQETPPSDVTKVTFSMEQLIADPTAAYSGGSVKLETQKLDDVLTLKVEATDANSGKIYKDNVNGFQARLYKSGTGKLVVTAAEGYEIVSATAIAANKGSNWWVAGSETAMSIADDKASASIGGQADMVVYSVTISYVAK